MKRSQGSSFFKFLLGAVLLIGSLLSVSWILKTLPSTILGEAGEVPVPNVQGKSLEEAAKIIQNGGLKMEVESSDYHESLPKNAVVNQEPKEGKKVKKNRLVKLKVSNGPEILIVPDVTGLNKREAEIALFNAKLNLGKVDFVVHDIANEDIVVEQDPKPLSKTKRATQVNLVVSKGLPPLVSVPLCAGRRLNDARVLLKHANLRVGQIQWVWDEARLLGEVLKQNPEPNSKVRANSMISFMVSGGTRREQLQMKQSTVQFTIPPSDEVREVEVIVSDDTGSSPVYKAFHHGGDKIEIQISTIGQGHLEVFVGGKQINSGNL